MTLGEDLQPRKFSESGDRGAEAGAEAADPPGWYELAARYAEELAARVDAAEADSRLPIRDAEEVRLGIRADVASIAAKLALVDQLRRVASLVNELRRVASSLGRRDVPRPRDVVTAAVRIPIIHHLEEFPHPHLTGTTLRTTCCDRSPVELPEGDVTSGDREDVTCPRAGEGTRGADVP